MSEELKITKEKILEISEKCPQAKEILNTLFPQAFENTLHKGQIWECLNDLRMLVQLTDDTLIAVNFNGEISCRYVDEASIKMNDYEFIASSLKEYLDKGGVIR